MRVFKDFFLNFCEGVRKVQPKEVDRYGWVNAQRKQTEQNEKKYTEILRPVVEL